MIRVLIVDDHEMVRLGISSYLEIQDDIEVIAEACNGREGYELALELKPDIILMDLVMDEMDGIEATQNIMKDFPEAKIIILTSFIDDEKVYPAMEAGAKSYILKTSSAKEIVQTIRDTYSGDSVLEEVVSDKLQHKDKYQKQTFPHDDLTPREKEVLQLIASGMSNQEIADELFITLKTVKTHVSNILSKLDVTDRTQATVYAFTHNLVEEKE